jgi:hypothetical protein
MNQESLDSCNHHNSFIRAKLIKQMEERVVEEITDEDYRTQFMPCRPLPSETKH